MMYVCATRIQQHVQFGRLPLSLFALSPSTTSFLSSLSYAIYRDEVDIALKEFRFGMLVEVEQFAMSPWIV